MFTDGFAGLGARLQLVALPAVTLVAADLVDADLAAGVRVRALVYIYRDRSQEHCETGPQKHSEHARPNNFLMVASGGKVPSPNAPLL